MRSWPIRLERSLQMPTISLLGLPTEQIRTSPDPIRMRMGPVESTTRVSAISSPLRCTAHTWSDPPTISLSALKWRSLAYAGHVFHATSFSFLFMFVGIMFSI